MSNVVLKTFIAEPVSISAATALSGRRPQLTIAVLALGDAVSLGLACLLLFLLSRAFGHPLAFVLWMRSLLLIPITIIAVAFGGLYPALGLDVVEETKRLIICISFVQLGSLCSSWAVHAGKGYQSFTVGLWFFCGVALPVGRSLVRRLFARKSWWGEPVLLIGSGDTLKQICNLLNRHPRFGLRPTCVLSEPGTAPGFTSVLPVFHDLHSSVHYARKHKIQIAVLALSSKTGFTCFEAIDRYGVHFPKLIVLPPLSPRFNLCSIPGSLGSYVSIHVSQRLLTPSARCLKRSLDLLIAVPAGLLLLPVMLAIALIIKLNSPGPVFYGHRRIGRDNVQFRAWKFRTMVSDADTVLAERLATSPALRAEWDRNHKLRNDPRVTSVGAVLRKLSLDELPQLWNVLRSEMSIVGPRPICGAEVLKYAEYFADYSRVLPGITGLWQVSGRNETTYQERVQVDTYYVNNWSPWLDLYIISRTLKAVVSTRGAY